MPYKEMSRFVVMDLFIIIEEDGEYSYREWKIVAILNDKDDALKSAWREAMDNWQGGYHIQHWKLTESGSEYEDTFYLHTRKLRSEWTYEYINRFKEEVAAMGVGSALPSVLLNYTLPH